tara:strand:- start:436 stop:759 length:324 start_codon:yes stop_codon:yes gene_type:complete
MKQFLLIIIIILINTPIAKAEGPFLQEKLSPPEKNITQTLQKRSLTWIEGQWVTVDNKYKWKPGHWTSKKIGHVFINGKWSKSNKGWQWKDGYWKKININTWINLYS